MPTSHSPVSAAPNASFAGALLTRNALLLFLLGLATGLPAGSTWYELFAWPGYDEIERALLLTATAFGLTGLIELLAAPFLDRRSAPFFGALGHRRSWVASALAATAAVTAVYAAAMAASPSLGMGAGTICGIIALPVLAVLWISLDALRIELFPARKQAVALGAQYSGALGGVALTARLADAGNDALLAFVLAVLLAAGLVCTRYIDEPEGPGRPTPPGAGIVAIMAQPWKNLFVRYRSGAPWLLAATAAYALGASIALYLGMNGYVVDLIDADRSDLGDVGATRRAMAASELVVSLVGAGIGTIAAWRLAPARVFVLLQCALIGLALFFVFCRAALGFTVVTVAMLFALRTLLLGAAIVIYGVVAARLTARPHTAAQFAILGLFVSLFWISESGMNWLGPTLGSHLTAALSIAFCGAAIACMTLAARASGGSAD